MPEIRYRFLTVYGLKKGKGKYDWGGFLHKKDGLQERRFNNAKKNDQKI